VFPNQFTLPTRDQVCRRPYDIEPFSFFSPSPSLQCRRTCPPTPPFPQLVPSFPLVPHGMSSCSANISSYIFFSPFLADRPLTYPPQPPLGSGQRPHLFPGAKGTLFPPPSGRILAQLVNPPAPLTLSSILHRPIPPFFSPPADPPQTPQIRAPFRPLPLLMPCPLSSCVVHFLFTVTSASPKLRCFNKHSFPVHFLYRSPPGGKFCRFLSTLFFY